jgi:hypothetical protein
MAALQPTQLLLLRPGSEPPLVQQDAAAPLYSWSLDAETLQLDSPSAAMATAGAAAEFGRQLRGCALVQQLVSGVCQGTASQACCAVSFWAGYVCEVRHLGRWCAGEQRDDAAVKWTIA